VVVTWKKDLRKGLGFLVRVVGCHLQRGPEESKGSWLWSWSLVVTWKKDLRKGLGNFFKFFGQGSPGTNSPSVGPSVVALTQASLAAQSFFRHRSFLVSLLALSLRLSLPHSLSLSLSSCLSRFPEKEKTKFRSCLQSDYNLSSDAC
jgi:hypothetical protein